MPPSGQKYLSKKSFFLFLYLFDLKLTELSDIYVKLLLNLKIVLFVGFPCRVKFKVDGLCSKWMVEGGRTRVGSNLKEQKILFKTYMRIKHVWPIQYRVGVHMGLRRNWE